MKKLITFIMPDNVIYDASDVPDEIEIVYFGEDKPFTDCFKRAKGKFSYIAEGDLEFDFSQEFYKKTDECTADILEFNGSLLIKTALYRSVKRCSDKYTADAFASMSAKSVEKSDLSPFVHTKSKELYDENLIAETVDEFNRVKTKLPKEIYTLCSDIISSKAVDFYACALIALHNGKIELDKIVAFDKKIGENVFLSRSTDSRFTLASLPKLRKRDFKLNIFEYLKIKSRL